MMAKLVKDSKGRECAIVPIDKFSSDLSTQMFRADARAKGYEISCKHIGGQKVPCVLVPTSSQELHDAYYKEEDKEQKRRVRAERPMIPSDKRLGKMRRCPTVIPNPEYHGQEGVNKTIKNDCTKCPRMDTCEWWKSQQESVEDAQEKAGDASKVSKETSTSGIMPDEDRFQRAKTEILAMIKETYPEYYDAFEMLLDGVSRNKVVKAEEEKENGLSKSNLYNLPKDMKEVLADFLDTLWYLNIDTDKYRK